MKPTHKLEALPEIPRKRYFAIGEVSELCGLKAHVLRYWEQEFPQLRPSKRAGNRRYYQRDDVEMVRRIRSLLYEQGYSIGAARQRIKEQPRVETGSLPMPPPMPTSSLGRTQQMLAIRTELEALLSRWPV